MNNIEDINSKNNFKKSFEDMNLKEQILRGIFTMDLKNHPTFNQKQ